MANKIFLLIILFALFSCSGKTRLSPEEYIDWMQNPENELNVCQEHNDFVFTAQYEPSEYRFLLESKDRNTESLEKWRSETGNLIFMKLRIASADNVTDVLKTGGGGYEEFAARQYYCSYQINTDLVIVSQADTLPCVLSTLCQTYGTAPYIDINLLFEKKDNSPIDKSMTMIFSDNGFTGQTFRFNFKKESILGIPELILK